jgi:outer membrane lipoprotein-sorting protein
MNCDTVKSRMADLLDESISLTDKIGMIKHLGKCPECAQEFEAISLVVEALTPKSEIQASSTLKASVMKHIENTDELTPMKKGRIISLFSNRWVKMTGIAAILLIAFGIITIFKPQALNHQATAAQTLLDKSFVALSEVKSMIMHFKVRTIPEDNFDLIEIREDFVEHTLWKEFGQPGKWKIQKPGITVLMDGSKQYKYMEKSGEGFVGNKNSNLVDWMKIFLDPLQILQTEKDFADKNKADYTIKKTGSENILTVKAKAMGDLRNSYRLNTSIPESNNRRVYHFDKLTNLLKSVEIYIIDKGKETEVLKVDNIQYDIEIPASTFVINLPEGVKWVEIADIQPDVNKAGIYKTSDEAAKAFFEALSKDDWSTVFALCPYIEHSSKLDQIKSIYGGLKILKLEKSFKSGLYGGMFVPYEIKLKSGETLSHKLALRNDNKSKVWTVDGGF